MKSGGKDADPRRPRPLDSGFPVGMTVATPEVCVMTFGTRAELRFGHLSTWNLGY
jgi:hypothetical protein